MTCPPRPALGSKKQPLHCLVSHGSIRIRNPPPVDFQQLQAWFQESPQGRVEGIVWHCGDGTLLKVKPFRKEPPHFSFFFFIGASQNHSVIVSAGPLPPPGAEVARRDAEPQRPAAGRPPRPDGSVHRRRRRQGLVRPPVQTERTAVQPTARRPVGLVKGPFRALIPPRLSLSFCCRTAARFFLTAAQHKVN